MDRVIGTGVDPKILKEELRKLSRNGTPPEYVKDTLFNGVSRSKRINTSTGEASQLYVGEKCSVSINPDTGVLIQCNLN